MQNELTIKDIAKLCNISVSTVSRVINDKERVSEETRKKVLKVIEELNYVPNNAAVSMVKKKTKTIAVIVPEINNPFYTAVIEGTESCARNKGYFTLVFSTGTNFLKERDFFNGILSRIADGVIIVPTNENMEYYKKFTKPIIFVDNYVDNCGCDAVVVDNFGGAYQGVTHIIGLGHKKIAIISLPMDNIIGKERYKGYEKALRDNNIEILPQYIKRGTWYEDYGYKSTIELLDMNDPPTAIFAANDLTCQGSIKALSDRGVRPGIDIFLLGFDENQLADFVKPKVPVIKRPTSEIGKIATQILLDKIEGNTGEVSHRKVVLGADLIIR